MTLGGTGKEKGKRHPTIGNRVVIASGVKVLGSFTVGDNSNIGANSVVLREVPPNSTVVGIPGRIVKRNGKKIGDRLDHTNLPDPLIETFRFMQKEINELKSEIERLKANETNGNLVRSEFKEPEETMDPSETKELKGANAT